MINKIKSRISKSCKAIRLLYAFFNWRECIFGLFFYLYWLCLFKKEKRVLMVEAQPWHGEILPGYVKYFTDLGYEVDLLVRYANYKDSPFVKVVHQPRIFCFTLCFMLWALRSDLIKKRYEHVFLSSDCMFIKEYSFWGRFSQLVGRFPQGRFGGWAVEHDLSMAYQTMNSDWDQSWIMDDYYKRIFALTKFSFNGHNIPMLNPLYFGENNRDHFIPHKVRHFVIVGRVSSQTRDFLSIFHAFNKLNVLYKFRISIIGKVVEKELLRNLPENITVVGYVKFKELYKILEDCDFLLPLLSPEMEAHRHYLYSCTSGSRQLSLGFKVPMVIQKDFASHYGFSEGNAILYSNENEFQSAMENAILCTENEYEKMVGSLHNLTENVYQESLENLRKCLKNSTSNS